MPWSSPPPSFATFLSRVLELIPELRPVVEYQIELSDGEVFSTSILDDASTAVMKIQYRVMEGTATPRGAEIVQLWIELGEEAMDDPYVSDVFLQTAGDELLFDTRGRSLRDRLGPKLRAGVEARRPPNHRW